jgi:hypothetical protein
MAFDDDEASNHRYDVTQNVLNWMTINSRQCNRRVELVVLLMNLSVQKLVMKQAV